MILDMNHPDHPRIKIYDSMGKLVTGVRSYDTETTETELVVYNRNAGPVVVSQVDDSGDIVKSPLFVKTKLLGSTYKIEPRQTDAIDEVLY